MHSQDSFYGWRGDQHTRSHCSGHAALNSFLNKIKAVLDPSPLSSELCNKNSSVIVKVC